MAMTQASSRLEMLQARFQQKQIQEKEQKLLQLYDQQQQRAYQVVQRGSAGSTGSVSHQHSVTRTTSTTHTSSTSQGGKVRQMFDERRQTTVKGIDRSYPLEPLDNKLKKQIVPSNGHVQSKPNQNSTAIRQTVTVQRIARVNMNSNINGGKPIVSHEETVSRESFGNENYNGKYHNEGDRSPKKNGVHIEEILDNDSIERNRMLAKIHLMEYDENLRHRVNNDINNEQFPEDLMIDVPDKLPRKPITRKLSQAEARLEKFKSANAKRSSAAATTITNRSDSRKRSTPMFPGPRTTPRDPTFTSKRTEAVKTKRSVTEPLPRSLPIQSSKTIKRKVSTPESIKPVEPNCPTILGKPTVPVKTVTAPVKPVRSVQPELVQTVKPVIKSPEPSPRAQKSPSPEPAGRRSATPVRRSFPTSPVKNPDIVIRRRSAGSKSPDPQPVRRSLQGTPKSHNAIVATDTRTALEKSCEARAVDSSDLENVLKSHANDGQSLKLSSTTSKNDVRGPVTGVDENLREKDPAATRKSTSRKVSAERKTTQNQRHPSPTASSSPRPPSALSTASSTTNSTQGKSSAESQSRRMATKAKNSGRAPGTTSMSSTKSSPPTKSPMALSSDALVACRTCGRRFAQDRVSLHEKICAKSGQKKRKQFDAVKHRVQGTELEAFAKVGAASGRKTERNLKANKPEIKVKSNWRRKHEDFINAIRSAKQVQAHLAAGGKLSDLAPPPASDTSDYIQCPHCGRKFNQGAADRHIPKCATMMHNKPNPRAPPKPKR